MSTFNNYNLHFTISYSVTSSISEDMRTIIIKGAHMSRYTTRNAKGKTKIMCPSEHIYYMQCYNM